MRMASVICVAMMFAGQSQASINIDGIITAGEWAGAATYTIGLQPGGASVGTAYLKADTSFIYGAFDITGWTPAMGAASGGNLLGFGVWGANGGYGTSNGVEFQQSTTPAAWGGGAASGTMNGLPSRFLINTVAQGSIPAELQAMDSFASGNRVWEVKMPISTMGVSVGETIYVVGGINYANAIHWYPANPFPSNYAPLTVEAAVPEAATIAVWSILSLVGAGMIYRRRAQG
jgi:hypothetical protein